MPYILNVPFADKDEAKALGAYWLIDIRMWVIPDHIEDINRFAKWIPASRLDCIVRKPYLLAKATRICWKCGQKTPVMAPAAVNYYHLEQVDEDDPDGGEVAWVKGENPTLFSYLQSADLPAMEYLKKVHPQFKYSFSKAIQFSYWANTCKHCGILQGDFELHDEPGGPFFPIVYDPDDINIVEFQLEYDYAIEGEYGGQQFEEMDFPEFYK